MVQTVGGAIAGTRARNLSRNEAEDCFRAILEGEGSEAQLAALFVALRSKGTTCDELAGFAAAARARIRFPDLPEGAIVISTSRLGKFRSPPTGLAAVAAAAAAGTPVLVQAAPHARGAGCTIGDVWQRMVGSLDRDTGSVEASLRQHGLACWRPTSTDDGWAELLRVEDEIGLRSAPDTVSKLLAPEGSRLLVAAMPGPVLGVASDALAALGHRVGLIVQGVEGSIDPSVRDQTRGVLLEEGSKVPLRLRPDDLALSCDSEPSQDHEDRIESAIHATREALAGAAGPAYHAALMGAAMLLRLAGRTRDIATAVGLAREAVESGAADHRLEQLSQT